MEKHILKASLRKETGRKVKTLRKKGFLPANIFGKKVKSLSITLILDEFKKLFNEVGETGLVSLVIEGTKGAKDERAVLVANVQMDPVSDLPIHIDFHQVDLKEKVTAEVPVEMVGKSPAEKQSLGTVVLYINEIEVEALPMDLPEKFVIDISKLTDVDQVIFVKDLDVDRKKVELKVDAESIVVKVEPPQKEEVITPPPTEVIPEGEEAPLAEGETAKGGETKPEGEQKPSEEQKPQEKN